MALTKLLIGTQMSVPFICSNQTSSTFKLNGVFAEELVNVINTSSKFIYNKDKNLLTYSLLFNVTSANGSTSNVIGTW